MWPFIFSPISSRMRRSDYVNKLLICLLTYTHILQSPEQLIDITAPASLGWSRVWKYSPEGLEEASTLQVAFLFPPRPIQVPSTDPPFKLWILSTSLELVHFSMSFLEKSLNIFPYYYFTLKISLSKFEQWNYKTLFFFSVGEQLISLKWIPS